jgi:hypothetical protein
VYSPYAANYSWRKELRIRGNIFVLVTMTGSFKGTNIKKIELGIIYWHRKNLRKKVALFVYGEYSKWRKVFKLSISQLAIKF